MISLMMSLFLFNQQVDVIDCKDYLTVIDQQEEKQIDFFNLLFYPSQQEKACQFIMHAKKIQLVEENNVEDAYYVMVDGVLLQEMAIQQDWARINSRNPQFLYAKEMRKEKEIMVVNQPKEVKLNMKSWLILGVLLLIGCVLGLILTKL